MEALGRGRAERADHQPGHSSEPNPGDDSGQRQIPGAIQTPGDAPKARHDGRPHRHRQVRLHHCKFRFISTRVRAIFLGETEKTCQRHHCYEILILVRDLISRLSAIIVVLHESLKQMSADVCVSFR